MKGEIKISEKSKILIELMEGMKEVQRMQRDYFKHLITLSTGSILILIAIVEKVFINPQILVKILIMFSLFEFAVAMIFSLLALPNTTNAILHINGLQISAIENDEKEMKSFKDKFGSALDNINLFYWEAIASYIAGVLVLLVSVGFYFFIGR